MQVRLLGPVEIAGPDAVVAVGGTTAQAVLALIAIGAPAAVTTDRLIEEVWGDDPPAHAANALQARVSALRRALRDAGGTGDELVRVGGGYALRTERVHVDAVRFAQQVDDALVSPAGDAAVRRCLAEALGLWRGAAMSGLEDVGAIAAEIHRLEELRALALEQRIARDLALGDHPRVVAELEELVRRYPLRERLWALRIDALAGSGRAADALRVHEEVRRLLAEELGILPGAELQAAERRALDPSPGPTSAPAAAPAPGPHGQDRPTPGPDAGASRAGAARTSDDAAPDDAARDDDTAAHPPAARPTVRRARNPILGRDEELRRVREELAGGALVTVSGPGGVGKTRLARAVADDWDGPVLFVELDTVESVDTDGVLAAVVEVAGIRVARGALERDRSSLSPTERLGHQLRGRNALVVVDNCEHVLSAAATVIDELADVGDLTVLATSREALGIDGEQVVPLRPLGDHAAELFVARARAVRPGFDPDDAELEAIRALCERMDGLPLAIELAAARVRTMRPSELLDRLGDRHHLLRAPRRSGPAHHTSVTDLLDWSLDLLFVAERRLLARLSVFSGSFSLDAAEAVGASDELRREEVVDLLDRLVDKSLLVVDDVPARHGAQGTTRYRLLHLVRSHVAAELVGAERADASRRHLGHLIAVAEAANAGLRGPGVGHWVDVLEQEQAELGAALDHAFAHDHERGVALVVQLTWFWFITGRQLELLRRTAQALAVDACRGQERMWIATLAALEGHLPAVPEAIAAVEHAADDLTGALTRIGAGAVCLQQGMSEQAAAALARARQIFLDHDDDWGLGMVAALEGMGQFWTGDLETAEEMLAVAHDLVRVSGDPWQLAILTSTRADLAVVRGDYERAEALLTDALASATELRLGHGIVQLTTSLADLAILRGDPEHAVHLLDDARRRAVSVGAEEMLAQVETANGLALHRLGRPLDAAAAYRKALDHLQPGFKSGESLILCRLADVDLELGDLAAARTRLARALDLVGVSVDRLRATALALEGWAALLLAEGRPDQAAQALGSAERLRADAGAPLASGERMSVDRVRCALEREIGGAALAEALAEAATVPVSTVVDALTGADGRMASSP